MELFGDCHGLSIKGPPTDSCVEGSASSWWHSLGESGNFRRRGLARESRSLRVVLGG